MILFNFITIALYQGCGYSWKFFTNVKISYFIGSQGHNKTRFQIFTLKL